MGSPPRSARAGGEARAKAHTKTDVKETSGVRDVEKGERVGRKERPKPLEKMGSNTTVTSTFDVATPVVKSWRAKLGIGKK